jgi:hypothetical protein
MDAMIDGAAGGKATNGDRTSALLEAARSARPMDRTGHRVDSQS